MRFKSSEFIPKKQNELQLVQFKKLIFALNPKKIVMKTWILFLTLFCLSSVFSQEKIVVVQSASASESSCNPETDEICDFPAIEAEYPGGWIAVQNFISSHIIYPKECIKDKIQGKVFVSFVVERDGKVTNIKVEKGSHPLLDEEAKRMISIMPNWIPGKVDNKTIRSRIRIPIAFTL